ncbi:hypothetical protein F5Y13DRAFT_188160 [Hypoxylon sp. FL1857]|nr:hypothetical protein F5Y13DRAFT_188160 [Hypoxylon sp. FL1857]
MCFCLSFEICCEGNNCLVSPYSLKVSQVVVLCYQATLARGHELARNEGPIPPAREFANRCPDYDPQYTRCERVFWSSCEHCVRLIPIIRKDANISEDDIVIFLEYNRHLREDLGSRLLSRPYKDLVRAMPSEFGISRRYMLSGSRWVRAPEPTLRDALGPNPPFDSELDGLKWWLEQGFGGEGDIEIWNQFCTLYAAPDASTQTILNWIEGLPSTSADYAAIGAVSASTFSDVSSLNSNARTESTVVPYQVSFDPRRPMITMDLDGMSIEEYKATHDDWYPLTEDEEDDERTRMDLDSQMPTETSETSYFGTSPE